MEFDAASERIKELLKIVDAINPLSDRYLVELVLRSYLVSEYEEVYYPVSQPALADIIRLRMDEMNLTQLRLSELRRVSHSHISEYLSGKAGPTLKAAREKSRKLNMDAHTMHGA